MEKFKTIKALSIFFSFIGFCVIVIIIFYLKPSEKTLPNFITIVGTVTSLIGLLIAYLNIRGVKKIVEENDEKIERTMSKIIEINSLVDIAKAFGFVREIQQSLKNKSYDVAFIRSQDLKNLLVQYGENNSSILLEEKKQLSMHIKKIGIDLNILSDFTFKNNTTTNFSLMNKNFEEVSSFLIKIETKFKTHNYAN